EGVGLLTWREETFAYAEGWDESRGRYKGLTAGKPVRALLDAQSVLVKPEMAYRQLEADRRQHEQASAATGSGTGSSSAATQTAAGGQGGEGQQTTEPAPLPAPKLGRFHGSVRLDPLRLGRDAAQIAAEVVQHLTRLTGSQVEITLEIQAELPD